MGEQVMQLLFHIQIPIREADENQEPKLPRQLLSKNLPKKVEEEQFRE